MIHSQAIVDPKAQLADDVEVGPWTQIGPDVVIESGCRIASHVVISGPTRIGRNNQIFQFASVGEACQDKKYAGEPTELIIGDNNIIRESCTLHRGTVQDEGITRIGSGNLLMVNVHVAHDCRIGDNTIVANNVALAGHVHVDDFAIVGGQTGVHQFCRIGAHAMCGAASMITKDVPAYVMASGNLAKPHGINTEGLKRRGFSADALRALKQAYRLIYRQGLKLEQAVAELDDLQRQFPEVALLTQSLRDSTRGIIR
ncbi:acyl-ACP--UDP-N-acetylglucosamine O-acyltransferase [Motiliproteus sp.]|uniref:acyl-ACP--UDP-N-acetylglucosamine O-acyltransferase n=1 Tax=Motiliproteus sp. TaxID=1898955 RepID=UPI003BA8E199